MTKLISGRVLRLDSANVSDDRYQYLRLEEAEPDLGLPTSLGQVFTSNLAGGRSWVTLDTGNVIETSNLYYTNDRVRTFVEGNIFSQDVILRSNLEIYGDLFVQGNTVQLNTTTLTVEDKNIVLANGASNAATANGAGITIDGADASIVYDNSTDTFSFNKGITVAGSSKLSNLSVEDKVITLASSAANSLQADRSGILIDGASISLLYYSDLDAFVFSNVVYANVVGTVSSLQNLTTDDLKEGTSNLYFSNDKVINAVETFITTSNVTEGSNQYFTNTRSVLALDGANVYVRNLFAREGVLANSLTIRGIYVTNDALLGNVVAVAISSNILSIDSVTANLVVSNSWGRLYTANVKESPANLYYTNSRVLSAVTPVLTTSNVIEGDNLYYDNSRVFGFLAQNTIDIKELYVEGNLFVFGNSTILNTETLVVNDKNIVLANGSPSAAAAAGAGITIDGADATILYNNASDSWDFNKQIRANVTGTVSSLSNHDTGDLVEGDNLYYTNTRVVSAVTPLLITSNVLEGDNLYYTNSRVVSAVTPILTTANVSELDNLYFTNTRALLALDGADVYVGNLISHDIIQGNTLVIRGINVADDSLLGNVQAGGITGNTLRIEDVFANEIITDVITANTWNSLFTSNITEYDNLFYTNTRVLSAVTPLLVTSNVLEGDNLYYTNTRVDAYINDSITTTDISEGDNLYYTNSRVVSAVTPILTTANVSELDNLYYTNTRVLSAVTPLLVTSNVLEGDNLYYTNTRVVSAVTPLLVTSNVLEGDNLYYTNSRVLSAVTPLLVTSNVLEGDNLYYTNARVDSRVAELSINVLADVDTTGIIDGQTIVWDGDTNTFIVTTLSQALAADFSTLANVANVVTTLNNFTTSNLSEGINLYYTNPRAIAAVTPLLTTANVSELNNLYYTNTRVDAYINDSITTTDISEGNNLYYTNTRVDAYINDNITTTDIDEGSRQYFTNTRALLAVNPRLTTANVSELNNLYYTNTRVLSHLAESDVETLNITVTGNLVVTGNLSYLQVQDLRITDNMFYLNANSNISNPDLGWAGNYNDGTYAHAGIFRDASDGVFKIFEGYTPEPDESAFINTAHASFRFANVQAQKFIGRISTLDNHTTSNLTEGSRLYYTNTRVLSAVNPRLTTANVTELNNLYYTNARVDSRVAELSINVLADVDITDVANNSVLIYNTNVNKFVPTDLVRATAADVANLVLTLDNFTTSNVAEGSNFYYTNTRVLSAVNPRLTTANVTELNNLYYTNTRVLSAVNPRLTTANVLETDNLYYTNTRVLSAVNPLLTTSNVIEGDKLYYTNARVDSRVAELSVNVLADVDLTGIQTNDILRWDGNVFVAGSATATADFAERSNIANVALLVQSLSGLNTDNLTEGTFNLYYTNTRVLSAVNPRLTTANVSELNNLYYTNSRVQTFLAGLEANVVSLTASGNITAQNIISTGVGAPTITSPTNVNISANGLSGGAVIITDSALRLKNYTTVDRGNLTPVSGDIIYNTSAKELQFYNGSEWISLAEISERANVSNTVLTLSNFDTDDLLEANNLYYTNSRVISAITSQLTTANILELGNLYYTNSRVVSAVTPLLTTSNVVEGNNLYYTDNRVASYLGTNDITIKELIINGNLYVQGNVTSLNTGTLSVEDKNIVLANGAPNAAAADGAGITIEGANASITYNSSSNKFVFNKDIVANVTGKVSDISNHSVGELLDVDTTGVQLDYVLAWNGSAFVPVNAANADVQAAIDAAVANLEIDVANINVDFADLSGQVSSISNWTTSNLSEGVNLYYTNSRVLAFVSNRNFTNLSGNTTTDLSEGDNLYYTNSRVVSAVTPLLTTSNVTEGTNLYFTPARALDTVNPRLTTANVTELNNLYYTDARVKTYLNGKNFTTLEGNTTTDLSEGDNLYYTNARVEAYLDAIQFGANVAANITLENFSTSNLAEGTNLYFTNLRARSAFYSGKGISISADGKITSQDDSYIYNLSISGAAWSNVYNTTSNVLILPQGTPEVRYIVRSLHLTNISEEDVYFSGNMVLTGNVTGIANKIPLPYGTSLELLVREQVFLANDIIQLTGFNSSFVAQSNLISVTSAYEPVEDTPGLGRTAVNMTQASTNYVIYSSPSTYSILESLKIVNMGANAQRIRVAWADANNVVKSYLAYNLALPTNSLVEVFSATKKIDTDDKIIVSMNGSGSVNAILSYRQAETAEVETYTETVDSGSTVVLNYSTELPAGTTIHYTIA